MRKRTARAAVHQGAVGDGEGPLVLIVDDVADNRTIYVLYLKFSGFRIAEADNGEEALRQAEQLLPDVIVMDLSMGGLDGVSSTRQIMASDPHARVVVLSSFGRPTVVDEALRAGACGFLVKGEPVSAVADAIRDAHRGERPLSASLVPGLRRLRDL